MAQDPSKESDPALVVSDEAERARAVAAFLRDQEERAQRAFQSEQRSEQFRKVRQFAVAAAWIGIVYVWVGSPAWLTVQPPPVPTIAEEGSSLRLNVFLQSQKVEAYRLSRGRLPFVLDEAGPRFRGMEYRRQDNDSYEITGRSDRVELRYESRQPALEFVGEAADLTSDGQRSGEGS